MGAGSRRPLRGRAEERPENVVCLKLRELPEKGWTACAVTRKDVRAHEGLAHGGCEALALR